MYSVASDVRCGELRSRRCDHLRPVDQMHSNRPRLLGQRGRDGQTRHGLRGDRCKATNGLREDVTSLALQQGEDEAGVVAAGGMLDVDAVDR